MPIRCRPGSPTGLRYLVAIIALAAPASAQTPDGKALFAAACASCHDGAAESRAPSPDVLRQRSPDAIMTAMAAGAMRPQASRLTGAERRAIAEYVTGKTIGGNVTGSSKGRCDATPAFGSSVSAPTWNGWGVDASAPGKRRPRR